MNARKTRLFLASGAVALLALALLWSGYSHTYAQGPIGLDQSFVTTDNGTLAVLTRFSGAQTAVSGFSSQQVGSTTGTSAGAANNPASANQSANSVGTTANAAANNAASSQMTPLQAIANRSLSSQGFNGNLLAQLDMNSSATATFDTRLQLNAACNALVAFRMTDSGSLVSQPVSCAADMLSISGTGGSFPATYFFALGSFGPTNSNPNSVANTSTTVTNQTASSQVGSTTGANQATSNQVGALTNQTITNQVTSALANRVSIISRSQVNNAVTIQGSPQFLANQSLRNQNFNGNLIGQVDINAADTITFDTQSQLGTACSSVVVFRMDGSGNLVQHPVTCTGNILTLTGTGGDFMSSYFFAQSNR